MKLPKKAFSAALSTAVLVGVLLWLWLSPDTGVRVEAACNPKGWQRLAGRLSELASDTTGRHVRSSSIPSGCQPPTRCPRLSSLCTTIWFFPRKTGRLSSPRHGGRGFGTIWGGTVQGLGGYSEGVGGVADHVHLLVGLRATHRLAGQHRSLSGKIQFSRLHD